MKILYEKSFLKDIQEIQDKNFKNKIQTILVLLETAHAVNEINSIKKLRGHSNAFRIRVGQYRIGLFIENDTLIFIRCLPRKSIYSHFP